MRIAKPFVLLAFGVTLFVATALVANLNDADVMMRMEFGVTWIARVVGIFMATVSSLVLLLRGLDGATMEKMIPMTLPLLAGVVLIEPHWTTALALAGLALGVSIGLVIQTTIASRRTSERPSGEARQVPEDLV